MDKTASKRKKVFWMALATAFTSFAFFVVRSDLLYCEDTDPWSLLKSTLIELVANIRSIVTVLAILLLIIVFAAIMITKNPQKIEIAKTWAIRIVVCWALIFCVGTILSYINDKFLQGRAGQIEDIESASLMFIKGIRR